MNAFPERKIVSLGVTTHNQMEHEPRAPRANHKFPCFRINFGLTHVKFLWEVIQRPLYTDSLSCHQGARMSFVNVRRVMLKHKRGAKCPLLVKFLSSCVEQSPGNFVSTAEIFEAYESAVRVWTDDDSVSGQTKFLMKRNSFNKVSILQRSLL